MIDGHHICFQKKDSSLWNILGPSGKKIDATIREREPKTYYIEFEPVEVGSHLVEVYFNGVMLKNFPYVIKVYDTNKIKVIHPDRGTLDESVKLQSELSTVLNVEILSKVSINYWRKYRGRGKKKRGSLFL